MALEIIQDAPAPARGRVADVDLELVTEAAGMIERATRKSPLSTGEIFTTKKEAETAGRKLAKQVDRFRDDPNFTVGVRAFIEGVDPEAWDIDNGKWVFGIYLAQPRKKK